MAQEIQRKLEETEVKQRELESRGVSVEKALRGEGGKKLFIAKNCNVHVCINYIPLLFRMFRPRRSRFTQGVVRFNERTYRIA